MKNLILTCLLFVSLISQAQDKRIKLAGIKRTITEDVKATDTTYKEYNPNGSYSVVEKTGDKISTSTKFSYINNGKTTTITNPDGTQSIVVNDISTGNIFAADGTLSTTLRVVTSGEAKVMEASVPKGFYVTHTDSSTTIGLNIITAKSASTYSSTSTTTTTGTTEKQ